MILGSVPKNPIPLSFNLQHCILWSLQDTILLEPQFTFDRYYVQAFAWKYRIKFMIRGFALNICITAGLISFACKFGK